MDPIVIDDAVPSLLFERFQREVLSSDLNWRYIPSTAYRGRNQEDNYDSSFTHVALYDGRIMSDSLHLCESVLLSALSKIDMRVRSLLRLRLGMFMRSAENFIHPPHIDSEVPHMTALLYVNESDGDTFLYKERYQNFHELNAADYYQLKLLEYVTIEQRVTPKPNRLVVFDGLQYHASSSPVASTRRIVLNCNFIGELDGSKK